MINDLLKSQRYEIDKPNKFKYLDEKQLSKI